MNDPRHSARGARLKLRANIIGAVRTFFTTQGYLEVETPLRIPVPAPETHIDPQPSGQWVLHTSPELCMKRLLAAGYRRIFQICKCFRSNERGRRHLPEMTMLEWYTVEAGCEQMMDQCQELILAVSAAAGRCATLSLSYQGHVINLQPPWERLSVAQAFGRYASVSMSESLATNRFDEIMGLEIEPQLGWGQPVFLYDYPLACGALARRKPADPELVERFELYIGGVELCNAFGELTDPEEQRRRFEAANQHRSSLGKKIYSLPEPFLAALENMPAATGNALGLDRLVMLLADTACIDDVVAFTPEEL
jgi:lysyl-tRNA synthetase class 2